MPYTTRKRSDGKIEIVRLDDGKVVGVSDNEAKANASIAYRMGAEKQK